MPSIFSAAARVPAALVRSRRFAPGPRAARALAVLVAVLAVPAARAEAIEQGFVFRNEVHSLTADTPLAYAGSLLTAGFQFSEPITVISTSNALISGPGFVSAPALLDASGLVASTASQQFQDRAAFRTAFPPGTFRFQFPIPVIFDASVALGADDFPSSAPAGKRQRLTWGEDQRSVRIDFPAPLPLGPVELKFTDEFLSQAFQDLSDGARLAAVHRHG